MSWRRRSTTTEAGSSLAELIVATGILMGITVLLAQLLVQNQRASHKISEQSDVTATLMLVFEKVRNELKHCRVVGTDPDTLGLRYWLVRRDPSGLPMVTAQGMPDWLPGAPADPDVALLYLRSDTGTIWREFQGATQPLAPLGPDAQCEFTWNPSNQTVVLAGTIGTKNDHDAVHNNVQNFAYQVCMSNNE